MIDGHKNDNGGHRVDNDYDGLTMMLPMRASRRQRLFAAVIAVAVIDRRVAVIVCGRHCLAPTTNLGVAAAPDLRVATCLRSRESLP